MTDERNPVDPAEVAAPLRAVLAAVDAREVEADGVQRAYLAGAAGALALVPPSKAALR